MPPARILAADSPAGRRHAAHFRPLLPFLADAFVVCGLHPPAGAPSRRSNPQCLPVWPGCLHRSVLLDTHRPARRFRPAQSLRPPPHHAAAGLSGTVPCHRRLALEPHPFKPLAAYRPCTAGFLDIGGICPRTFPDRIRLGGIGLFPNCRPRPTGRFRSFGRHSFGYIRHRVTRCMAGFTGGQQRPSEKTLGPCLRRCGIIIRRPYRQANRFHPTHRTNRHRRPGSRQYRTTLKIPQRPSPADFGSLFPTNRRHACRHRHPARNGIPRDAARTA